MVRFKHRYLLVHLIFPSQLDIPSSPSSSQESEPTERPQANLTESGLIGLLRDSLSVNSGDIGAGEVGGTFSIKYLSPTTSTVIIRVSREHYRTLWAALTLLRKVGGHECIARVVHVSGTIRKTQHSAIAHDRTQILLSAASARRRRQSQAQPQRRYTADEGRKDEKDQEEVEEVRRLLRESEERIEAMEA
ncbi:hypothetical protein JCM10908_006768 [Rhodotorula pacifica]|uniref:RNA-binding protein POP5 n=1 Tax=Rhodotorula pacifica TaxID=1495444 RepID=UPI00317AA3D8